MLFRYKIEKSHDHICDGVNLIHYNVTIQKYHENNMIFKWVTRRNTTLKGIVELLGKEYYFDHWNNALSEIFKTIAEYGGIDKLMAEYIHKFIITEMEREDMMNDIEKSIDDLVLTNDWKTIEFKENK